MCILFLQIIMQWLCHSLTTLNNVISILSYSLFDLLSEGLLEPFGASMEERSAAMTATAMSAFLRSSSSKQKKTTATEYLQMVLAKQVALNICPVRSVQLGGEERTEKTRLPNNIARLTCAHTCSLSTGSSF